MKTLISLFALATLTSCTGFMGLEYETLKYGVGSNHRVVGQALAGQAQGDGKYEIVIGKRGDEMQAWVERDGKVVDGQYEARRLFVNPYWPLPKAVATKSGTPRELGLYDVKAASKRSPRWLLRVHPCHRVVSNYRACAALYGEENVKCCTDGTKYWIEATINGKTYAGRTAGVFREHYQGYVPNSRSGKWVEQWRGSVEEYVALGEKDTRTAEEIAENRKKAHQDMALLTPWYWQLGPIKKYGPTRVEFKGGKLLNE